MWGSHKSLLPREFLFCERTVKKLFHLHNLNDECSVIYKVNCQMLLPFDINTQSW